MGSAEQLTAAAPAPHPGPAQPRLTGPAAWVVLVASVASRSAVVVALSLGLWSLVPAAFGMTSTTVMSGSMEPAIRVGDQIVTRPILPAELQPGQVVLVDDPDHAGRLRLHRFAGVRDGGLVLRGDANAADDSTPVQPSAVRGVAFLRVPLAGLPMYWARTGQWAAEAAFLAGSVVLLLLARSARLLQPARGRRAREAERARRSGGRHATAGASSAAAAVIALTVATGAGLHDTRAAASAFSAVSTTQASSFGTGSFPCLVRSAPTGLAAAPSVYYSFAEPTGTTTTNLAAAGNDGVLRGSVDHVTGTCGANASPAISVGGASRGSVTVPNAISSPLTFTLAIWFRTSSAGGLIAGFGDAGDGTASSTFDRQLTMNANGTLTFRVVNLLGASSSVTTPNSAPATGNYADNQWHQAVLSLTGLGPMTLSVDGSVAASALLSLALSSYTGYWRFGYDATPASTTAYFTGQLDEAEIWNGIGLGAGDVTRLLNAGR